MTPTPRIALPWERNPSFDGGPMPPFLVGDSVIVAVPLRNGGYDIQILTATEAGWDRDGEYWSDWMWDDVEYYIPLDGHRTGEEIPW